MEIYLYQNSQQTGPYTEQQLRDMVASGSISRTELAWHEGLAEWMPLDRILVFSTPSFPPPPPPPPAQAYGQFPAPPKGSAKNAGIIKAVVAVVIILGFAVVWKYVLFHKTVYRTPDEREGYPNRNKTVVTFLSSDEVELSDGASSHLTAKYTKTGNIYRVMGTENGNPFTAYWQITSDGLIPVTAEGSALRSGFSMPEFVYTPAGLEKMREKLHPSPEYYKNNHRDAAVRVLEDLRLLDSATDQYAIETNKLTGMNPTFADLKNYLKPGTPLYSTGADVFGQPYGPFTVDSIPKVPEETFNALRDVADENFWSPFH